MKKFLPLLIFVLVFTAFVSIQVGWHNLTAAVSVKKENDHALYEELFLRGKYQTIDGKSIENSKLQAPVVIYNFWASWCLPCLEEMPSLMNLKKKFSDQQLVIMAFNTDEEDQMKNIHKSLKKLKFKNEFLVIADKQMKIAESFKLNAIPVTIIFNRGKVVLFNHGPLDFNSVEMQEKIKKWIAP